jgi:hypothetical protein
MTELVIYCRIALLWYCFIVVLLYCPIALLWYCFIVVLLYCCIDLLFCEVNYPILNKICATKCIPNCVCTFIEKYANNNSKQVSPSGGD